MPYIMTSDTSHAFRRCPWRFYTRFHLDKSDPMQPSRQAFEGFWTLPNVEKLMLVHLSGRQGNIVRTLGQAFWVLQVFKFLRRHWLGNYSTTVRTIGNTVRTLFSVLEDSSFPLLMRKGIIVVTVQTLGQQVRTRSWYGKLLALFWKGSCSWLSGCSVKPFGCPSMSGGFWTRLSIFITTFQVSDWDEIGVVGKLTKIATTWTFGRNVQTAQRPNGKWSAFGHSPEFEKFQNSFSNMKTASNRPDALRFRLNAA
jgi:hypothetical protein